MKKTVLSLLFVATALGFTGCGGSSSDQGSESDQGSDVQSLEDAISNSPKCSDVWKVGETLDLSTYEGCLDGDTLIAAVTSGCYDTKNQYVGQSATYKDTLWVVQTGTDPKTGEGGTPGKVTDADPKC